MTLGERIYSLRTGRGMSQDALAEVLEVSRQSVSKWETDASVPDLDKLVKLSEYFGITLDALVKGEETPVQTPKAEPEPVQSKPQSRDRLVVGGLLVGFSLLAFLVYGLDGALLFLPVLLCGAGCLLFKRHTALWSLWLAWLGSAALWPWATSVSWVNALLTLGRVPGNLAGVLSVVQLLALLVLVALTFRLLWKKLK